MENQLYINPGLLTKCDSEDNIYASHTRPATDPNYQDRDCFSMPTDTYNNHQHLSYQAYHGDEKLHTDASDPPDFDTAPNSHRPSLTIVGYRPASFYPGSRFTMQVQSNYCFSICTWHFRIVFGATPCYAQLAYQGQDFTNLLYDLSCPMPCIIENRMFLVPLRLEIINFYGQVLSSILFGNLTSLQDPFQTSTQAITDEAFPRDRSPYSALPSWNVIDQIHSHQTPSNSRKSWGIVNWNNPQQDYGRPHHEATRITSRQGTEGVTVPPSEAPQAFPNCSVGFTQHVQDTSTGIATPSALNPSTNSSPYSYKRVNGSFANNITSARESVGWADSNLPLKRVATTRNNAAQDNVGSMELSTSSEVTKAVQLRLDGNFEEVPYNWSIQEKDDKRRLIRIERRTTKDTVILRAETTTTTMVQQTSNGIYVSCIWWEEKEETYITSVDMLSLSELLVGFSLRVEEKNRIRRNLEGFKPVTIVRTRRGCSSMLNDKERFFKVIMGFDEPRPRNIEKDIKVFPWKLLPKALQKIASKFTLDFPSIAPVPAAGLLRTLPAERRTHLASPFRTPASSTTSRSNGSSALKSQRSFGSNSSIATTLQSSVSTPSGGPKLGTPSFTMAQDSDSAVQHHSNTSAFGTCARYPDWYPDLSRWEPYATPTPSQRILKSD